MRRKEKKPGRNVGRGQIALLPKDRAASHYIKSAAFLNPNHE